MIDNLEETDTTPYDYIQVGKILKHDGTDYGKAVAVYNWMINNGWGSCVYHALETYYVCQGISLECAYAFCTDSDEDAFYPYDENGEYRDWKIEVVE